VPPAAQRRLVRPSQRPALRVRTSAVRAYWWAYTSAAAPRAKHIITTCSADGVDQRSWRYLALLQHLSPPVPRSCYGLARVTRTR